MERYQNIKKGTEIGLIIAFILVLFDIVVCSISFAKQISSGEHLKAIINLGTSIVLIIFSVIYALRGYKKPHGNMLRFLMFFFSITVLETCIAMPGSMNESTAYCIICMKGFAALLIAYISGRLQKIEKNRTLMAIAGLLLTIAAVVFSCSFPKFGLLRLLSQLSQPAYWAAICLAYNARYEEHKEAGLEDKVKKMVC